MPLWGVDTSEFLIAKPNMSLKNVHILVPESAVIEAVSDPRYLFTTINQFLISSGKQAMFNIQLVGLTKEVKLLDGIFSVHPDVVIQNVQQSDLIIIPALSGGMNEAVSMNQAFIPWIVQQYDNGAEVASLCLGAFLLGATGLLNGKQCSTHWLFAEEFRNMYPDVELVDGSIITEEGRIYSSGGANSYWNLLLYLVEKYTDREIAVQASKFFAIDIGRDSQSSFMMFRGQRNHNDADVKKAQDYIEKNYQDRITVDMLADKLAVGRRNFERRFKKVTNNTVIEYIQRLKVEVAKRSFESSRQNVSEVMFTVGYTDIKAFRDVFKKITGLTPIEYRNRYNKQKMVV
jgi:transcriptional regulator GlxA family with amidase domain